MRRMGLRVIYQRPRTTVPGNPSERFTSLVDLRQITSVDQIWATDITEIPLLKGFIYLLAIIDHHSRLSSVGSCRTALTWSSAWMLWRWPPAMQWPQAGDIPL
jgi:hypothetical protein